MRSMKRLALLGLLALPMVLTGCEKLGDATGPNLRAPGAASAAKVKVVVGDTTTVTTSSAPVDVDVDAGYELGWP